MKWKHRSWVLILAKKYPRLETPIAFIGMALDGFLITLILILLLYMMTGCVCDCSEYVRDLINPDINWSSNISSVFD